MSDKPKDETPGSILADLLDAKINGDELNQAGELKKKLDKATVDYFAARGIHCTMEPPDA